jgi:RNA polymerase sigma factor (sigma-70 family)
MTALPPVLTNEQQYFSEVRRLPPLSDEEYADLAQQIRLYRKGEIDPQEGQRATERMLTGHLRAVARMAWKWTVLTATRLDYLDLIQTGNMALMKVMQDYPFEEEGQLGKCLHKRVAWAIVDAIYETANAIRIPAASFRTAHKEGRAHQLPMQPLSLDQMIEQDHREDAESLLERLEAPAFLLRPPPTSPPDKVHLLALLFAELNPRERDVLQLRYGLGDDGLVHSVEEIIAILGITEGTVHDHERRAMQHIRDLYTAYAQERGDPPDSLGETEGLIAFLEQRRSERQQFGVLAKTRVVNAQLYQAFTNMQAQEERITFRALARKAGVSCSSARKYLTARRYQSAHEREQEEIQQRLKAAYNSLCRERIPITYPRLAEQARVCRTTAYKYLKARAQEATVKHGR